MTTLYFVEPPKTLSSIVNLQTFRHPYILPVYLGDVNINHIKNKHPYEYECYFDCIEEIMNNPDYYGINP